MSEAKAVETKSGLAAKPNPASPVPEARDRRAPMFQPEAKLHVPEGAIPGYKLYWFRGMPGRLAYARRVGFEYVKPEEIQDHLLGFGFADGPEGGNTDMGDRVSVAAQEGVGPDGQFLRLYLMKIKQEWWDEDMVRYTETKIDPIVESLKAGMVEAGSRGESPGDIARRYRRPAEVPEIFKKKV